jgi:hypothetical protein
MSCQGLGYKDASTGIRLYTKAECDTLGGTHHGNGECTKAEGGSWSWDCRNEPESVRASPYPMDGSSTPNIALYVGVGLVGIFVLSRFMKSA